MIYEGILLVIIIIITFIEFRLRHYIFINSRDIYNKKYQLPTYFYISNLKIKWVLIGIHMILIVSSLFGVSILYFMLCNAITQVVDSYLYIMKNKKEKSSPL
ncbi:MAG: hypothetical protein ACK5LC_17090 [Coprobacillaceae bacterium]